MARARPRATVIWARGGERGTVARVKRTQATPWALMRVLLRH
jgi:hypothetical protein